MTDCNLGLLYRLSFPNLQNGNHCTQLQRSSAELKKNVGRTSGKIPSTRKLNTSVSSPLFPIDLCQAALLSKICPGVCFFQKAYFCLKVAELEVALPLIANIRWIMEKAREFQKNIYFCFINYAKAFDCVDHNKLWKFSLNS